MSWGAMTWMTFSLCLVTLTPLVKPGHHISDISSTLPISPCNVFDSDMGLLPDPEDQFSIASSFSHGTFSSLLNTDTLCSMIMGDSSQGSALVTLHDSSALPNIGSFDSSSYQKELDHPQTTFDHINGPQENADKYNNCLPESEPIPVTKGTKRKSDALLLSAHERECVPVPDQSFPPWSPSFSVTDAPSSPSHSHLLDPNPQQSLSDLPDLPLDDAITPNQSPPSFSVTDVPSSPSRDRICFGPNPQRSLPELPGLPLDPPVDLTNMFDNFNQLLEKYEPVTWRLSFKSYRKLCAMRAMVSCLTLHCGGSVSEFARRWPKFCPWTFNNACCMGRPLRCDYFKPQK